MKKMRSLFIITLSLTLNVLFLDLSYGQKTFENQQDLIDTDVNPGNMLDEMRLPPAKTLGTILYNEEWKPGIVYLTNEEVISGFDIRFDVQKNHLEIKSNNQVKICAFHKIDKFEMLNGAYDTLEFISANNFEFEDGVPLTGFFEVLYNGDMPLYSRSRIELIESNYVPTVDVGRKDNKLVIREDYFVLKDGVVYEVQNSKKKNQDLFDEHFDTVKQYAKDQHLKFSKREDLVKLVDFYNSLI